MYIFHPILEKMLHFPPIFTNLYTSPPLCLFNLRFVCFILAFFFPLFGPWCIYASCCTAPASDLFSVPVMRLHHSVTDLSWPPSSALYDVKGVLSIVKYHLLSTTTLFVLVILFFNICWLLNHGWDTSWSETGASVINHRPQTDSAFIFTKWHFLI